MVNPVAHPLPATASAALLPFDGFERGSFPFVLAANARLLIPANKAKAVPRGK